MAVMNFHCSQLNSLVSVQPPIIAMPGVRFTVWPLAFLCTKVRRPGSDHWEDIGWDEAIAGIARHVKDTRERTLVEKNAKGEVVNRTPGMAWIGGCTDTNEFNYLVVKTMRSLGLVYIENQARV